MKSMEMSNQKMKKLPQINHLLPTEMSPFKALLVYALPLLAAASGGRANGCKDLDVKFIMLDGDSTLDAIEDEIVSNLALSTLTSLPQNLRRIPSIPPYIMATGTSLSPRPGDPLMTLTGD